MSRRLAVPLVLAILGVAAAQPAARVLVPPILTRVVTAPGPIRPTVPALTDYTHLTPPAQPFARGQLLAALNAYEPTRQALLARSARPGGNPDFLRPLATTAPHAPSFSMGLLLTPGEPAIGGAGWLASMQLFGITMENGAAKLRDAITEGVIPLRATQAGQWLLSVHLILPSAGPGNPPSPYAVCFGLVSDISKPLHASDFTLEFQAEQETITIPLGELPDSRGFVALIDAPPGEGWMFLRARRPDLLLRFTYVQLVKI